MKRIICIGECAINMVFESGRPAGVMPGGRIACAAALMAAKGLPVVMASEASADPVGDMAVKYLTDAGVDTSSLDRFTEGRTPLMVFTQAADGTPQVTRYENYADEAFDIVWPRVDDDSVVVYGGYYALDPRMRTRMVPFLNHCAERKAVMVYVPGFMSGQVSRITRVMPAILENLELANLVVARNNDLNLIFGTPRDSDVYADHIDFYCRSLVNVDTASRRLNYFSGKEVTQLEIPEKICETMTWNAGVVAGVVGAIYEQNITPERLETPDEEMRRTLLTAGAKAAQDTARTFTESWQAIV